MEKGDFELAFKDANYAITDDYIRRIMNNSARVNPQGIQREILFRVGRTIDGRYELPSNFDIYASLVAALVGRYSGNISLSGIPLKIAYWEIWNEPDLTFFWNSNDLNRYYAFYSKIAWKIKELDPNAKVGGPGVANGYNPGGAYLDGPLSFCRTNNVPLDFLWHYYANTTSDPQNIIDIGNNIQNALQRYGFCSAESLCTEWNSTPQASVNVFTKVQSAQNASYIASSLIYMQSCKVDRAYYYRGDALTFGLFNDEPNPVDRNYKSFCTYAAQAFAMFNQLKQTPNLLTTSNTFATGISVLAGKSGNTVKILVANHRIDRSLSQPNVPPPSGRLYRQHYVDSGRKVAQMTDDWTVQHYFGGKNPATLRSNNVVNRQSIAQQIPNNGRLSPRSRNYGESSGGVSLNVTNLPQNVASLEARRITEGADLSGILAPIMGNVSLRMDGSTCVISDPGAVEYSVTLYTLTLGNTPVNPNNSTNPTQPGAGGSRKQGDHFIFQVNLFTNFTSTIYMAPSGAPATFFVPQNSVWAVLLTVSDTMMTGLVGTTDGAPFTVINSGYYGRGVRQVRMDVRFTRSGFMNELFQSPPCGITLNFGGLINRRDTVWVTFTYRY